MKTVFIAGATGYLGRHLVAEYKKRGWRVRALVRNASKASSLQADELVEAQATEPKSLRNTMTGCDLVVSALGITRQKDGLDYWDVDYQANINLMLEALESDIPHFAYIHVLNADKMADVPLVGAKHAFVSKLQASSMQTTVIAPSGYFSDMQDFVDMARKGRVWLFGSGQLKLNPIDGADLAAVTADAIETRKNWVDAGGPDIFNHEELARLAFKITGKPVKITFLPDFLRRVTLKLLPYITPKHIHGPALFFLTALGMDMEAPAYGSRHLEDHLRAQATLKENTEKSE